MDAGGLSLTNVPRTVADIEYVMAGGVWPVIDKEPVGTKLLSVRSGANT